jgi:hypothetical protein
MIQSSGGREDRGDGHTAGMGRTERNQPLSAPLPFAAMVACVIAGFLALDHFASADEQLFLGAATWLILIAACASLDREDRARALLVVVVATCAEVLGSIVLGAYTYRLENLPAFVPPGHGLVFLAGLAISRSKPARTHERAFLWSVIGLVGAWGAAGLVLLGRTDALGAITGAVLIYVLLRSRRAALYAGVFLMVGFLEIYGTSIGAWHWAAMVPGTPMPAGNPPSGIAGVYVLFDIAAIALAPRALAVFDRLAIRREVLLRHLDGASRRAATPPRRRLSIFAPARSGRRGAARSEDSAAVT